MYSDGSVKRNNLLAGECERGWNNTERVRVIRCTPMVQLRGTVFWQESVRVKGTILREYER